MPGSTLLPQVTHTLADDALLSPLFAEAFPVEYRVDCGLALGSTQLHRAHILAVPAIMWPLGQDLLLQTVHNAWLGVLGEWQLGQIFILGPVCEPGRIYTLLQLSL